MASAIKAPDAGKPADASAAKPATGATPAPAAGVTRTPAPAAAATAAVTPSLVNLELTPEMTSDNPLETRNLAFYTQTIGEGMIHDQLVVIQFRTI